jgi:hypothetical protein
MSFERGDMKIYVYRTTDDGCQVITKTLFIGWYMDIHRKTEKWCMMGEL